MATEYTPNYNLDLYASADKPNLRDQYNAAMGKVDAQMKKTADDVTNANANVLAMQTQVSKNKEDIAGTQADVTSLTSRVTTVEGTASQNKTDIASLDTRVGVAEGNITEAQNDIASLDTRVGVAEGNIASLDTRVRVAEGNITEAQNDIDGLQSTVNQKAPLNHASTDNTYGQGSSTDFGHLKVTDNGNAAASSGTAASPKMVADQISALKALLAPQALEAAHTVNYNGGITGSGIFSIYANPITKVVSVQLKNESLSTPGSGGYKTATLGTIPSGYRPTRLLTFTAFSGDAFLHINPNGTVELSFSDDVAHSAGAANGCGCMFFGVL